MRALRVLRRDDEDAPFVPAVMGHKPCDGCRGELGENCDRPYRCGECKDYRRRVRKKEEMDTWVAQERRRLAANADRYYRRKAKNFKQTEDALAPEERRTRACSTSDATENPNRGGTLRQTLGSFVEGTREQVKTVFNSWRDRSSSSASGAESKAALLQEEGEIPGRDMSSRKPEDTQDRQTTIAGSTDQAGSVSQHRHDGLSS
jgi:hypothetical protein